ncbi:MAG: ADP-ribosylglycohydrolase family protein [Dehalococcoidia bacterium]
MTTHSLRDKARGCLVGAAVGDAFGMPLEFSQPRPLATLVREMTKGRLPAGTFTDDTQMMIALAQSLLHHIPLDTTDLALRFLAWYRTNPPDIGLHTRLVLERLATEDGWQTASDMFKQIEARADRRTALQWLGSVDPENVRWPVAAAAVQAQNPDSAGNGSLMRCFPVALVYHDDMDACIKCSSVQGHVTHPHGECTAADAFVSFTIVLLLKGTEPALAVQQALDYFSGRGTGMTIPLEQAIRQAHGRTREELPNTGWVRHTVESSIWALLNTDSFRDAIVQVVNLGGDADTAGAVTGALAGAAYGLEAIPGEWQVMLQGRGPSPGDPVWRAPDFIALADQLLVLPVSQKESS